MMMNAAPIVTEAAGRSGMRDDDASGTEVLLDVRLRAAGRQVGGETAADVQATDPRPEAEPGGGRRLRADRRLRTAVLETADGEVPRRAGAGGQGGDAVEVTRANGGA